MRSHLALDALRAQAWRLVRAQGRMLEQWGEDGNGPFTWTREELWRELHEAGHALRDVLDGSSR